MLKISHLVYFLINNCAISHITYYILFCIKHIALCYLVFSREQSFYNNNFFVTITKLSWWTKSYNSRVFTSRDVSFPVSMNFYTTQHYENKWICYHKDHQLPFGKRTHYFCSFVVGNPLRSRSKLIIAFLKKWK